MDLLSEFLRGVWNDGGKYLPSVVVSIVTALATLKWKLRADKDQWIAKEVCEILKTIRTDGDVCFSLVLDHFKGCSGNLGDSRKEVAEAIKAFQYKIESLQHLVNSTTFEAVKSEYATWYKEVLGEEFPIQKKTHCFKVNDQRIREREKHHRSWCNHLDGLKARCLKNFRQIS